MITHHDALILLLDLIRDSGYLSKTEAAIQGKEPTSVVIAQAIEAGIRPTAKHIADYGAQAAAMLDWLKNEKLSGNSEFIDKMRQSLDLDITKAYGYLACLPKSYTQSQERAQTVAQVTKPDSFAGDAGTRFEGPVTLVGVQKYPEYIKCNLIDDQGHMVVAYQKPDKKAKVELVALEVGKVYDLRGTISKLKFGGPVFETVVSRSTLREHHA